MTLHPQADQGIPEDTAETARAAYPNGNPYMTLRDELGPLYQDEDFQEMYEGLGRGAVSPGLLATVTVLQYAEGLSDRQAADNVRGRIDWKYLLGLPLKDPGFDHSILNYFRERLLKGEPEQQLLDTLLKKFQERKLLGKRGKQRTDATYVLAAVRKLNRIECVGETLRQTLNVLAKVAGEWLQEWVPAEWYQRYERRFEQYRLPSTKKEYDEMVLTIGADGYHLLERVLSPEAPVGVRDLAAVEILWRVWVQNYYQEAEQVHWREAGNMPPAKDMLQTPYDPEARYCRTRRGFEWTGYKMHWTETCSEEKPRFIVNVETTPAPLPDGEMTDVIHSSLAGKKLLPKEHYLDAGYIDVEHLVTSQEEHQIEIIGPVNPNTSRQALAAQGFDLSCFVIDWQQKAVICPQGKTSQTWSQGVGARGNPIVHVRFRSADCQNCTTRSQCTHSKKNPRSLKLHQQVHHERLQQARQYQTTDEFKAKYAHRAGVEGALSQAIRRTGLRRSRYIGIKKTHLQNVFSATAINLVRFVNWITEIPLAPTRTPAFAALAPS